MDDDIQDDVFVAAERAISKRNTTSAASSSRQDDGGAARKVQQPKPQALPSRAAASSILVNSRQKGNPVLANIRSMPWEYSDIPADFVLGATTCALFLSLKYHRIHPEYVYTRIKALAGKYNLRILLTMVDITNHEEPIKELSKTSIINNVTVILCWSAAEAGRYLEQYKVFENAGPTSIKAHQSSSYSDQLVEFVTIPRSINKTDAVGLVSNFGSIRTAINAKPEEIALIAGWGEKKVQRWCQVVREPFRVQRTAKRGLSRENTRATLSRDVSHAEGSRSATMSREATMAEDTRSAHFSRDVPRVDPERDPQVAARLGIGAPLPVTMAPGRVDGATSDADKRSDTRIADDFLEWEPGADEEEALAELSSIDTIRAPAPVPQKVQTSSLPKRKAANDDLSDGVMAALSKLRKT